MTREPELVRPWRGVSAEARIAQRRDRLLAAGLEVFATHGFQASKVSDVCAAAGLTQRYFYESFVDKEALLWAVAEIIVADFVAAAGPSLALIGTDFEVAAGGAAQAVISSLTDDPRRARILFVEIVGVSADLEDRRRVVIGALVDVLREAAASASGRWAREAVEVELIARAVVGAAQELLIAYVRNELPMDQDALVANLQLLFLRVRPIVEAMAPTRKDRP
jgi:AcrR family transcriptional regulator